jgi:hypothetical protein
LSERQARVFLMLGAVVARHQGELLHKVGDEDIEEAAAALASTIETAAKGSLRASTRFAPGGPADDRAEGDGGRDCKNCRCRD